MRKKEFWTWRIRTRGAELELGGGRIPGKYVAVYIYISSKLRCVRSSGW